jgi:tight adherence protein B
MALVTVASLILALVAAALCGVLALPAVLNQGIQLLRRSRLQARVLDSTEDNDGFLVILCRRGIPILRPFARPLLKVGWFHTKCEQCARALAIKNYPADVSAVCELLLASFGLLTIVVFLLTGLLPVALCAAALMVMAVFGKAGKLLGQWGERLVEQIPDALRSLGICFNAGYSLQQAFEQTAQDTPEPLGAELRQASFDVCAGRSIEEALSALEKRTKAADLRFAIIALEIQHRTGGSLQELLENAADAVLASADLRRQLSVQTAQARLSAKVVTILPVILVAVLSLAMEGYLESFFSSTGGLTILLVALGMEAAGVVLIRRILGLNLD